MLPPDQLRVCRMYDKHGGELKYTIIWKTDGTLHTYDGGGQPVNLEPLRGKTQADVRRELHGKKMYLEYEHA